MHIIVCVKQTPDSSSVYVDPITGQIDAERFVQILNPADACAIEAAVRLKEQLGGTIQVLTLGPKDAEGALRATLAIGADSAIRLWNSQADKWGPFTVAAALAAHIQASSPSPDIIFCGDSTSDWSSGIVGPTIAEILHVPQITGVSQLEIVHAQGTNDAVRLRVTRKLERGYRELLEAQPPLLMTVTAELNEPRYPSLPAHVAALRATIPVYDSLAYAIDSAYEDTDETTLLEMHTPRPRPRRIVAPNSHHSAFERIGEIVSAGATGRQTRLVEGSNEELAQALITFLHDKGFLE
ncbi:MAG TPA: electron transfer flavoprotein subunit beta/FixA family protein [Ktedonobacteraceae bacterium]|nr:electron transfer flavoprotein subunit beta/FixA family protein [Ktedonobacteraceae bacterium]